MFYQWCERKENIFMSDLFLIRHSFIKMLMGIFSDMNNKENNAFVCVRGCGRLSSTRNET